MIIADLSKKIKCRVGYYPETWPEKPLKASYTTQNKIKSILFNNI